MCFGLPGIYYVSVFVSMNQPISHVRVCFENGWNMYTKLHSSAKQ